MRVDRALREIAVEKGLSQAEICQRTGISSGHMSMFFNGKVHRPSLEYVTVLAHQGLGITIDELIDRAIACDGDRIFSGNSKAQKAAGQASAETAEQQRIEQKHREFGDKVDFDNPPLPPHAHEGSGEE